MKKIRQIFRNKVLILISLIAYRFSLDFLYVNEVAELWDYQHFEFHRDNIAYIISILWFCIIAWRENRIVNQKQASSIFEFLLNLLFFIPFSSYIGLSGSTTQFVFYSILYWLILTISFMYFRKNGKPKKKIYTNINVNDKGPIRVPSLFIKIAVPIVVINFFSTIYYNGLSFNISFDEIYDIRLAAREIKMPTILSYLKPISTPVLMILLIISIVNRKKLYTILLLFAQFENFAFGALKGDLFIMLLAVCIALFYRTGRNYYFLYAILLLNVFAIIERSIIGVSTICTVFHRRMLFMPSLLTSEYFDFFSSNEVLYFRDSFMRHFVPSPYNAEVPRLIGDIYYGEPDKACNTGIVGDDFAQLGWLALIAFPLLRGFTVKILDNVSSRVNPKLVAYVCASYTLSFISSSFFSILLTRGFIVICILLYIINKSNLKNSYGKFRINRCSRLHRTPPH